MSLESWKKEFYPVSADSPKAQKSDVARLKHSILKWRGLQKSNLKRHGVVKNWKYICTPSGGDPRVSVNAGTCALCVEHVNLDASDDDACKTCPIAQVYGRSCFEAYTDWIAADDPKPMLTLLRRTLKAIEAKK
jgi:hypothetical protein